MENTVVMNEKQCYEEPSVEVVVLFDDVNTSTTDDVVVTSGDPSAPEDPLDPNT